MARSQSAPPATGARAGLLAKPDATPFVASGRTRPVRPTPRKTRASTKAADQERDSYCVECVRACSPRMFVGGLTEGAELKISDPAPAAASKNRGPRNQAARSLP